jgi:hypothetical protein
MQWAAVAAAAMLGSAGCASIGFEFPAERVTEIRVGETTQTQVLAMFGDPWRIGVEDGQKKWTWGRYKFRMFGREDVKDLSVLFDERNVVSSYSYESTEAP